MKRFYCLIILLINFSLFAQKYEMVQLLIADETFAWESALTFGEYNQSDLNLNKGDQVLGKIASNFILVNGKGISSSYIYFNIEEYVIETTALLPAETECLFPEDWITDVSNPDRKIWTNAYYQDVLGSQNRETVLKYERNPLNSVISASEGGESTYTMTWLDAWLDIYRATDKENLYIYQASISIGNTYRDSLFIKNISPVDKGFKVTLQGDSMFYSYKEYNSTAGELDLPLGDFNLIFIRDGDYMDVYSESQETPLTTFILVEQNFREELYNLMDTNTCDLSNITWPTRADGSMDYPVGSEILLQNFIPTHKTITPTPLLTEDNPNSESTQLPVGTELRWIGTGTEGRINVLTAEGQEGWCSTVDLENSIELPNHEPVPVPEIPEPAEPDVQETEQNDASLVEPAIPPEDEHKGFYLSPANFRYLMILLGLIFFVVLLVVLIRMIKKKS